MGGSSDGPACGWWGACGITGIDSFNREQVRGQQSLRSCVLLIGASVVVAASLSPIALAQLASPKRDIPESFTRHFSTYAGGGNADSIGDITVTDQGFLYVTGWTRSTDFPTTPGAYDRTHNGGLDGYVLMLNPDGGLVWSTFIGSANNDLTLSIAVDRDGYVYVAGVGGRGFPTTADSFQPGFHGYSYSIYGETNGIVAKLAPDGSALVWASYFGSAYQIRDISLDDSNSELYLTSEYRPLDGQPPFPQLSAPWFEHAFQPNPQGSNDVIVASVRADGAEVLWATYLGGTGFDTPEASLAVAPDGSVYVAGATESADFPTPNGFRRTYAGSGDAFLAKLSADGSELSWGTFLGGVNRDGALGKHAVAVDRFGNAFLACDTASPDFPTLRGFQMTLGGGTSGNWSEVGDYAVSKFGPDGALLASTYVGGRFRDTGEGICLDRSNNVLLAGLTFSDDFPLGGVAHQTNHHGDADGMFFKISSDLSRLLYSSFMGTSAYDACRSVGTNARGDFYFAGDTKSASWPTLNAFQSAYGGGRNDTFIVKFTSDSAKSFEPLDPRHMPIGRTPRSAPPHPNP